ncbi:hypothetical protein QF025_004115 [Paraburkholderia graminis]|jgi:hypothetical protein|uniref:Uncharacterized protein n=1 Tax=Paraburkholderia graminis TaxID=60548 RepID=A0ABD5CLH7_9BURK|nr:hypothetical protein [Paraburkholderia graminis]
MTDDEEFLPELSGTQAPSAAAMSNPTPMSGHSIDQFMT